MPIENGDFVNNEYTVKRKEILNTHTILQLQRNGRIIQGGNEKSVQVQKIFKMMNESAVIEVEYILTNKSAGPLTVWFGVEFNFGLQAGHAEDRYYYLIDGMPEDKFLDSMAELQNIEFIGLKDEWRNLDIQLRFKGIFSVWRFPVETISLSEAGFERVYQSSVVLPNWKIKLQKEWRTKIKMSMDNIS